MIAFRDRLWHCVFGNVVEYIHVHCGVMMVLVHNHSRKTFFIIPVYRFIFRNAITTAYIFFILIISSWLHEMFFFSHCLNIVQLFHKVRGNHLVWSEIASKGWKTLRCQFHHGFMWGTLPLASIRCLTLCLSTIGITIPYQLVHCDIHCDFRYDLHCDVCCVCLVSSDSATFYDTGFLHTLSFPDRYRHSTGNVYGSGGEGVLWSTRVCQLYVICLIVVCTMITMSGVSHVLPA